MIMDSNVNMITINNKQTISLINDNNEINYKINNLN